MKFVWGSLFFCVFKQKIPFHIFSLNFNRKLPLLSSSSPSRQFPLLLCTLSNQKSNDDARQSWIITGIESQITPFVELLIFKMFVLWIMMILWIYFLFIQLHLNHKAICMCVKKWKKNLFLVKWEKTLIVC